MSSSTPPLFAAEAALLAQARQASQQGRVDEAVAIYRDILADPWPKHWEAFGGLWECCAGAGRREEALRILAGVAQSYEGNSWLGAGAAWRSLGRHEPLNLAFHLRLVEARKTMGFLLTSDKAHLQRAYEGFVAAGRLEEAAQLKAAAEFGPEDLVAERVEALQKAAREARDAGNLDEATTRLRELLALVPPDSEAARSAHEGLRDVALERPDLTGAREECRLLARLAESRGDSTAAAAHDEAASRYDPDDPDAWLALAREHGTRQRDASARVACLRALSLDPAHADAAESLVWLAHWRGLDDQQRMALVQLESADPARAAAQHALLRGLAERRPARVLRFAGPRSVGVVKARHIGSSEPWRVLGPAQGDVKVPPGKDVRLEIEDDPDGDDPGLSALRALAPDDLFEVFAESARIDDEALEHFAGLTGLSRLTVRGSAPACSGLLARLQLMSGRKISDRPWDGYGITGAGLRHLAGLRALRQLDLSLGSIGNDGLPWLGRLKGLESLDLSMNRLNEESLPHLLPLRNLRALNLGHTYVSVLGLKHLVGFQRLETLLMAKTIFLGHEDTELVARFPSLRTLDVAHCMVDVGHLLGCQGLERLNVSGNPLGDEELLELAVLPRLRVLVLGRTQATEAGIARFREATGGRVEVLTDNASDWMDESD
jgi:tetratricopeptide (TPR) repeat protein